MNITFLGGVGQVGRSAIYVKGRRKKVLLDFGVLLKNEDIGFPAYINPKEIDLVILTHAHLDHSGAIPLLYIHRRRLPVVATKMTFQLCRVLLADFIKVSGYYLPFEYLEVEEMLRNAKYVENGKSDVIGGVPVEMYDAGHIPGSSQVVTELEARILYTGDLNSVGTRLLKPADISYKDIEYAIVESTYATKDHPDRWKLEKKFVERTMEIVEDGGTVLIPAFGVGRSQEMLCIFEKHKFPYRIAIDGMAEVVNKILLENLEYLREPKLFERAVKRVKWIRSWKERRRVVRTPGVIISPAGMLKGGPAAFYSTNVAKEDRNAIFLVSYQIPGTPGRVLQEEGKLIIGGKPMKVKAVVETYEFSSHSGRRQLRELLKKIRGCYKVFIVHGEPESNEAMKKMAEEEGLEAIVPEIGEEYII
ncbi:MBL fold metallo-hydrolase [Candidatus Bathyarchaeota archaeon ex4484_205]|nr:MAG: MBL fold metallo-hydrolase [Candidatus Bathyarchaeota archaeon ex4484_205]